MQINRHMVRFGLLILSLGLLLVGGGFWFRAAGVVGLWPWSDGPLSYLFIASIVLAEAATLLWSVATLDMNAACGGALGFAAMNGGIAGYTWWLYSQRQSPLLLGWALVCGLLTLGALVLFLLARQYPRSDSQPTPAFARYSFLIFAVALFAATLLLLLRAPVVFPWRLNPDSSVMFGFLFLASAIYFFDGWLRPSLANAYGQLIGFLVYDLILIPPYLQHWPKTEGGFRISLAIFLLVLFWSAGLALWLFWKYRFRPRA